MRELLYIEIPTPDLGAVRRWLQEDFEPGLGEKILTPEGFRLRLVRDTTPEVAISETPKQLADELSVFVWSVLQTTYLKVFRWVDRPILGERQILQRLSTGLRSQFPHRYPEPPVVELHQQSIFAALAPYYPLTVKYFQKMPNGEYDLQRVYWWEQRWREGVRNPKQPRQVVFSPPHPTTPPPHPPTYDLIYVGGALGVIHAAVMAQLGYQVLLLERLPFGRMNREWNISRQELQTLIDLGLLTPVECESLIAREYKDGFNKFFDANNSEKLRAPILHTPTVLNVALDAEKLLHLCGEKLRAAGGEIWDETEFIRVDIEPEQVVVQAKHIPSQAAKQAYGRLLVDAMGTASPVAWQLNGGRAFDSVCPTVGAVIAGGLAPEVWDAHYGDVLNSHGDISRGRQLIWELFPGAGEEIAIYLFHYHQANPDNPGSLLEMYEDFFSILPEYRRCDPERLVWKKPTFGYIPGHFSVGSRDRRIAVDRLIALGDAASLQSPLVFTGFGSLVRNLGRLTALLDTALRHDLLQAKYLNQISAYQSNVAVTWLFSKGMMVPTNTFLPPQRINAMLNCFFGILAEEPAIVADNFIKDRVDWLTFNRLALKAAARNPALLLWIWQLAGAKDLLRWLGSYFNFCLHALFSAMLGSWFGRCLRWIQPWLEPRYPALWFWLLAQNYALTNGMGRPQPDISYQPSAISSLSP
ncbi:MAG: flavin-dependent dehydrogenase [Chroococcidiopsidaceae cyanobacterium CP_BM_RX_35]|nr:flavin-dependent dehydrogenase [Chroococcidiopsidaceae cyanobacterium CP_BM_RX_35]